MRRKLTEDDKKYLRENCLLVSAKELSDHTGSSKSAIASFFKAEGITIPKEVKERFRVAGMVGRTTATPEEDEIIKREYLITPLKAICDKFMPHRSFTFVDKRIKQLGLVIPPEIIAERKLMGRKKPGDISHNKGRKQSEYMSPEAIERTKATRFKKGLVPHNTREQDGEISIRKDSSGYPYKFIRVSLGKWELLQRVIWEHHNGPIPKSHIVAFKDGDSMNCDISNLELRSRADHAIKNNPNTKLTDEAVARYIATKSRVVDSELKAELMANHPDLLQLKRNQLLLNRAIKKHGKSQNRKNTERNER